MNEKLRVYYIILGVETFYKEVNSPEEAKLVIDSIAEFCNHHINNNTGVMRDHCSTAGLEYFDEEEKEWLTWYDENGYDIEQHFEKQEEESK